MRKTTRRKLLSGLGATTLIGMAGCTDTFDDQLDEDSNLNEFNFPDGFNENGLQSFKQTVGTESAHYNAEGLSAEIHTEEVQPEVDGGGPISSEATDVEVNDEEERRYSRTQTEREIEGQFTTAEGTYTRTEDLNQADENEVSYEYNEFLYNKENAYLVRFLRFYLEDLNYEDVSISEDNTAIYTAYIEDQDGNEPIFDAYDDAYEGSVTVEVQENGLLEYVNIDVHFEEAAGRDGDRTIDLRESIDVEFLTYNVDTVTEPEWLETAIEQTETPAEN